MKKKEVKRLYLLQTRRKKRYYTRESDLISYLNRYSKYSLDSNSKVYVFDYVEEFDASSYVENIRTSNKRDLKMKSLLEGDPTADRINQLKSIFERISQLSLKDNTVYPNSNYCKSLISALDLVTTEDELKKWVMRNKYYHFKFKTGDVELEKEYYTIIKNVHNFKIKLDPSHPYMWVKKTKASLVK
jgi:hypothetical protein